MGCGKSEDTLLKTALYQLLEMHRVQGRQSERLQNLYLMLVHVGRNVLEIAVSSAVITFNLGKRSFFDLFECCNIEPVLYTFCYLDSAAKVIRENWRHSVVGNKNNVS